MLNLRYFAVQCNLLSPTGVGWQVIKFDLRFSGIFNDKNRVKKLKSQEIIRNNSVPVSMQSHKQAADQKN